MFSWTELKYLPFVLYLGLGPGAIGHTIINFSLRFLNPMIVAVFLNFEPLIGGIIGWIAGYQQPPGWMTWVGGTLLIAGNTIVVLAGYEKNKEMGKEKELEESMYEDDDQFV